MVPVDTEAPGGPAGERRPVVAVANRLPVRQGEDGWELSPGGLVTALRPVMAGHSGAWVGWDGGTRGIPATMPDLTPAAARRAIRQPAAAVLPRVRQRHAVAAAARRDREAPLRAHLVAQLPGRERPFADRAWPRSASIRTRSPGSTTTTSCSSPADQGAAARSADRVLPARALAAAGHLRPAALAARRSCSGCSAPTWCPSTPRATGRTSSGPAAGCWPAPASRSTGRRSRCPTAGWCRRPARRSRSTRPSSPASPPTRRPSRDIEALREQFAGRTAAARRGPARLHQGHHRAAAGRRDAARAARRTCARTRRSCRSPCPAATTCGSTATCARRWNATSAGSTASSPSPAPTCRSTTCTAGCRRNSSPRTTRPPSLLVSPRSSTG